jgi:uncharacterized membrane protein YjfL (UPF0719 family)
MQDSSFYIATLINLGINLVYTIVALGAGLIAFRLFDKFFLHEIDFIEEIKKGNLAASLFASTILIFIAIVTGFVLSN